ncbi:hypothetical protein ACFFX0_14110 [Citricoccus parietis]|uniref:Uncharacterized protein n=1 Tax=Citricoccus parietis TaxID=592307 RepID=A0ABV5G0S5_9MICC
MYGALQSGLRLGGLGQQCHIGPVTRRSQGDGQADAPAASGHQDGPASQGSCGRGGSGRCGVLGHGVASVAAIRRNVRRTGRSPGSAVRRRR